MFDIDAGKILVVGVVALLVIGPKDLPRVLRTVGQTVGKMRRMASEFQNQFMEAIKEADLEDVKKEFTAIRDSAAIDTSFDAASLMRDEITTAVEGPKEIGQSTVDLTGAAPMKEIASSPAEVAPQELASRATTGTLVESGEPTGADALAQHPASAAPIEAKPAEKIAELRDRADEPAEVTDADGPLARQGDRG